MTSKLALHAGLLLIAVSLSAPAAADEKSAGKEQVKRLQQTQRKLEQEKSQLAQEKGAVETELKEAKSRFDEAKSKGDAASRRNATLSKELEAVKGEKDALVGKLAEAGKKLAETSESLRRAEATSRQLEGNLAQRTQTLNLCEGKNAKLHDYGVDLLEKYEKKGCASALLQGEPFTQLKRVELENLMEEYHDKLDAQKVDGKTVR